MYINDIVYINDVHILFYILFGIIGAIIGQFLEWANFRLSDHKVVFSKEIFTEFKKKIKINDNNGNYIYGIIIFLWNK